MEVSSLPASTDNGSITFNVWDTAGDERLCGLREGYYFEGDCAIIMFDISRARTFREVRNWHRGLKRVIRGIPTVLVGNKADLERQVTTEDAESLAAELEMPYVEISVQESTNVQAPINLLVDGLANKLGSKTT